MILGSLMLLGLIWLGLTWTFKKIRKFFINFGKQISERREKRRNAKLEIAKIEEYSEDNL